VTRRGARAVALALAAACCALWAEPLWAQAKPKPRPTQAPRKPPGPPRFELAAGAAWLGGYGLGQRDATLTESGAPTGGRFVLFRTTSDIGAAPGLDARFGVRVTRRVTADVGVLYSRPELTTVITGDVEQAQSFTATGRLSEYVVEGSVRYQLVRETSRRRLLPFVSGGAGYLRQLSDDRTAVETGAVYHAGGGVLAPLRTRQRGAFRQLGLRGDVRVNWRTGGFEVEETTQASLGAAALLYMRF
jgi:hypothetical protein